MIRAIPPDPLQQRLIQSIQIGAFEVEVEVKAIDHHMNRLKELIIVQIIAHGHKAHHAEVNHPIQMIPIRF